MPRPLAPTGKRPSGQPFRKGHAKLGGRKKGTPNRASTEMRVFLKSVIEDPEYQEALRARMIAGKAPQMEQLATYYTVGKPQDQVQVQTSPSMAKLVLLALQAANERKREDNEKAKAESARPPLPPGDGDQTPIS
jgi:hypothetical protein